MLIASGINFFGVEPRIRDDRGSNNEELKQCLKHLTAPNHSLPQSVLAEPMLLMGTSVSISASVGIAMFPADGRDLDTLLHRADMAMYQAKSGGRGQSRFYET